MRKLKIISVFLIVVLVVISTVYVVAQDKDEMTRLKKMRMGEKMAMADQVIMMADYLGLSSDQIKQLNDLSIDSQINLIKDTAAIEVSELQLKKLMSTYNADKQAINNTVDELYSFKKTKKKNMIDTHFKVISILTQEQFEKLREIKLKMGRISDAVKQRMMGMMPEQQMNTTPEQHETNGEQEVTED